MTIALRPALLLLLLGLLIVGLVPAGYYLDREVASVLERSLRAELQNAPRVLQDRWESLAAARMMHAKELSETPGLSDALVDGDPAEAVTILRSAPGYPREEPLLFNAAGGRLAGRDPGTRLLAATMAGDMPVSVSEHDSLLWVFALAPVLHERGVLGVAGVYSPLDDGEAGTLAGLTRSMVLVRGPDGAVVASSVPMERALPMNEVLGPLPDGPERVDAGGTVYLALSAPLSSGAATVVFARDLTSAMSAVPALRRAALASGGTALVLALLGGVLFSGWLTRPVGDLAGAAERLTEGDFKVTVRDSPVAEVRRLSVSFQRMRRTLEARLEELSAANAELEDRQRRLQTLQAELLQRDRVAAAGRVLAQLAHEIRNPVASVRNCLEILRRRVQDDAEAVEFAEMAIDELLRMHELAEQMLDLNRPRRRERSGTRVFEIAAHVRDLYAVRGPADNGFRAEVQGDEGAHAAIGAEGLTQVLINLIQNARDATGGAGEAVIRITSDQDSVIMEVADDGPGIPEDLISRIFDPFFSTKGDVQGVGLGLFTAEGIVRGAGGRITAHNRSDASGAVFRVELPRWQDEDQEVRS